MSARPGTGFLDVARVDRRSVVRRAFSTSPLRLLTPRNHGNAAWVYASSYGGGLVGGDDLRLTVRVEPGASAFLSSQASTKVYRSDSRAALYLDADVADGGQLIVWPDPVVCFAGSAFRQVQRVELADEAGLVLVDVMTSGRRASGERWEFSEYLTDLVVCRHGRVILRDALRLTAAEGNLAARMGRFDVLATIVISGSRWQAEAERIIANVASSPIQRTADLLVAAAAVRDGGCLLRLAGRSVEQVNASIRQHLSFVTPFLEDDPWTRKW